MRIVYMQVWEKLCRNYKKIYLCFHSFYNFILFILKCNIYILDAYWIGFNLIILSKCCIILIYDVTTNMICKKKITSYNVN